ncbi:MAG: DNA methylase N-4 [Gammaproteobacteria bacterium]|nr:DNA methylase N-4 [Gammaproteobacteria bacterium]
MDNYDRFLRDKISLEHRSGFELDNAAIHPTLFSHQRDIARWAIAGGRRAVFASFGLGKTFIQLEILRQVWIREQGCQLIIAPLGVRQEFTRDAAVLGMPLTFIRRDHEVTADGFYITNYESVRDGKLDPNRFTSVTLDEASVLRSYGSKTYQEFLSMFDTVKYRFVATATPSPNRYKELIHYAGFLGIMDTGQALTRFFQRDSTQANNLTLYPHKEREFWLWVSSWAIFLQRPSDLGYSDQGYDLPRLHIHYHEVKTDLRTKVDRDGQFNMFPDAALSLKDAAREKRDSIGQRIDKMLEIIGNEPSSHFLLWHDQEAERHAIKRALPAAVEVYGSQDLDVREQRVIGFSNGEHQYLATKPVLSGSGCNFQRFCSNAIFLGIGFKFNDFIQSVHRIYRFLQIEECHIHLIFADTEREILRTLERKWDQHKQMVGEMTKIIKRYGLSCSEMQQELHRSIGVERVATAGDNFTAVNNDCVDECRRLADNSIDLIHTSIPFSNHYEYTPSYNDFGHTDGNDHFWQQMDFLLPELLRVLAPGRVYACHVKDRIMFGNVTGMGMPTVSPFHAEAIFHATRHGFAYFGMITVVTDVVRENNQTYRLGWTEQCKDGSKMGVGSPEYVLLFRKLPSDRTKAYADQKVVKSKDDYTRARWQIDAHSFWRSAGDRQMTPDELAQLGPDKLAKAFTEQSLKSVYDYESHVRIGEALELRGALPSTFMSIAPGSHDESVWHDVNRMRTLNGEQSRKGLNAHICPLQFDIVDRIITRFTNPGEVVLDPFGGLMTVPYRAILKGRKGYGVELNPSYYCDGVKYLEAAEREVSMPSLFDFSETDQENTRGTMPANRSV